jgi:acetyltransferase
MGGIAAELLNDVNIGFPPLNQVLARRLMEKTAIYKLLSEMIPTHVDLKNLEEILVKFSQLIADFPEIKEVDINPLMVDEEGAIAVDSRMLVDINMVLDQPKSQSTPKLITRDHLVISAYPKRYCSRWKLKNGKSVALCPIKPEDETLLKRLFQSLSEQTMRYRFFQVIREVSHDTLTRYCNVDYNREIAIVAKMDGADEERMIGVARIILQPGRKEGEFAVVVGDKWQRQGLGSKLVDYIISIGKDMGLQRIYGDVLSDNVKMIKLCEKKGFRLERVDEEMTKAILEWDT